MQNDEEDNVMNSTIIVGKNKIVVFAGKEGLLDKELFDITGKKVKVLNEVKVLEARINKISYLYSKYECEVLS